MKALAPLFAVVVGHALAPCQEPLQIAGFPTPPTASQQPDWNTSSIDQFAALRYGELAGETTLLFVHTTIDSSVAGPHVARGVFAVYPFLAPPGAWTTGNAMPTGVSPTPVFANPTDQLVIPPNRVASHLAAYLGQGTPAAGFGTHNGTSATATAVLADYPFPAGLANHDERYAWDHASWPPPENGALPVFDVASLGRASVMQAAYQYALNSTLTLDTDSLDQLGTILDEELGFEIHIQAAHVTAGTNGGPATVRFSQRAVIRRRSLHEIIEDEWRVLMGAQRWVPNLLDNDVNVYLGGRAEYMHVLFPGPVEHLTACVLVEGNTWEFVDQLPNPIVNGAVLCPNKAVFPCPSTAVGCTVYFVNLDNPLTLVIPVGSFEDGALFWPFDPLPQHLPPPQ